MILFETIIIWAVIACAGIYLFRKFYRQFKTLTDPSSPPGCSDGCSSCGQSSCHEKKFPTYDS